MARKADESVLLDLVIDQVHVRDIVHKGGVRFLVEEYRRHNLRRTLTVRNLTFPTRTITHTWDMTHEVQVQAEHACDCNGTGVYSWGGSVNGVPVNTGIHYACEGKGWMSRSDVIGNHTYWNKYARV